MGQYDVLVGGFYLQVARIKVLKPTCHHIYNKTWYKYNSGNMVVLHILHRVVNTVSLAGAMCVVCSFTHFSQLCFSLHRQIGEIMSESKYTLFL